MAQRSHSVVFLEPFDEATGVMAADSYEEMRSRSIFLYKLLHLGKCISIMGQIYRLVRAFDLERSGCMSKHLSPEIRVPIEPGNPSIERIEDKCIKCGNCRDVCRDYISVLGYYDLEKTDDTAVCIHCGQCETSSKV